MDCSAWAAQPAHIPKALALLLTLRCGGPSLHTAKHASPALHLCTRLYLHVSAARCACRQPDDVELNSALYMVCKAVSSLHSRGIVHGDLRPANIMWFSSSFAMKLVDFGRWSQKGMPTPLKLSLRYAAPEVGGCAACVPETKSAAARSACPTPWCGLAPAPCSARCGFHMSVQAATSCSRAEHVCAVEQRSKSGALRSRV